jgi:radical SAM-linked protein
MALKTLTARIKYSKEYPANMIGHLDTTTSILRSLRMSFWPIIFTSGYNPRARYSATPPLSLGLSSVAEYIDVALNSRPDAYVIESLKEKMIEGIRIVDVKIIERGESDLNEALAGFRYRFEADEVKEEDLSGADRVKITGKGCAVVDIIKRDGNIRSPRKCSLSGNYRITKLECLWNENGGTKE